MDTKRITKRESNYELMRIIAMFFIVLSHVLIHGKVLENCHHKGIMIILLLINFFINVHVNSFVLLSGFFQSKSKFKQSKVWSIINASLFYRVVIIILFSILGIISLNKLELLYGFSFIDTLEYWFIKTYLLLYCLSPFLNKFINNLSKKDYQKLIALLFVILSIIPFITGGEGFENDGYSLYSFVFLYLIGAYLRKYPLKKCYIFKPLSNRLYQLIMIFIFISCLIINYLLNSYSFTILDINEILDKVSQNIVNSCKWYSNPLLIIQSVAFFEFFGTLRIKSKIINKIASLSFGIYLIHDNTYVRNFIYKFLSIQGKLVISYKFIFFILFITFYIYMSCAIIEFIRQVIFKFIYDRKISKWIRSKYYLYINSIFNFEDTK